MKKLSNWREEHRDEYGDLIGGPKISKKQLKKNLSSNEKDEKITRSESLKFKVTGTKKELSRASINSMDAETRKDYLKKQSEMVRDKLLAQDKKKLDKGNDPRLSEEKKCGKGQYFCNDSQKCKPIPEGYHVMPDGMLMKGKKHSVKEALDSKDKPKVKKVVGMLKKASKAHASQSKALQQAMDEEAWQRKEGKNKSGGLNEKGRKSYERANPGSDLKAPSKKKGNKRRASFCARMKGMKKKLTSAKTARDPDSRINKSLRAWNC